MKIQREIAVVGKTHKKRGKLNLAVEHRQRLKGKAVLMIIF
jgi:hypothetical protein